MEDEHTGDGATRRYDASQPIGDVLSITEDGVDQTFEGASPRWEIDTDQQRFELAAGETATPNGDTIKFAFVSDEALVLTADDAAAITDIGFPIARRYEDDTIDNVALARGLLAARLDRHNQRFEEFITTTKPGAVTRLRHGVAPTWNFPRQGLNSVRLLVESVSERLGAGGGAFHPVVLTIRSTALDYQGDAGDAWRATTAFRPPAPRPATGPGTDADQRILRPGNVARPARLPIDLGGSPAILMSQSGLADPRRCQPGPGERARDRRPAHPDVHRTLPAGWGAPDRPGRWSCSCGTRRTARRSARRSRWTAPSRRACGTCCGRSRCRCAPSI